MSKSFMVIGQDTSDIWPTKVLERKKNIISKHKNIRSPRTTVPGNLTNKSIVRTRLLPRSANQIWWSFSTNKNVDVNSDTPKIYLFERPYVGPYVVLLFQFFAHVRLWSRFSNARPTGDENPQTICNNKNWEIGTKFSALRPITLGEWE